MLSTPVRRLKEPLSTQYTSETCRRVAAKYGIRQSMNSLEGRCHDNARCKSMWVQMKEELLYGKHDTAGFPIHSFSTFERIKKYDENGDAGNVGKPYSIEVRDTERTITIYGIASTRFDIAG